MTALSIAIICGGPSLERGISLNSARSTMDHLLSSELNIEVIYVNRELNFYHIAKSQLYSNTPTDFDFKLHSQLENPIRFLSMFDIILPLIHGRYGEDGELQKFLEEHSIPFLGSSSIACKNMFSKSNVNYTLRNNGFDTTQLITVSQSEINKINRVELENILNIKSKVIVKPNRSGSSIGVSIADSYNTILEKINDIISQNIDDTLIIEEYCEGQEFTVIVLENNGMPVALIPTEIEIISHDKLFDYRKKYLPTNATRWHSPPRFKKSIVKQIMSDAERIFKLFNCNDFIRIDGWLLDDGRLVFTDINPISGLEQNSFVFQQATLIGMTHRDLLFYILQNACSRYNLKLPTIDNNNLSSKNVFILFGGDSAERQVSLMSGTNIWLKLLNSNLYRPKPFLLDGDFVWFLPYHYTISHTVEEIKHNCDNADIFIDKIKQYIDDIRLNLGLYNTYDIDIPIKFTLNEFFDHVKLEGAFLFLGLHGDIGEDGTIQLMLEKRNIKYNGSNSTVSKLCMNKYETGKINISQDIKSLPKVLCEIQGNGIIQVGANKEYLTYEMLKVILHSEQLVIKPCNDGCSAGVIKIINQEDLQGYIDVINDNILYYNTVEMPRNGQSKQYIIEPWIEVDKIIVQDSDIIFEKQTGWIEMTVGIVEDNSNYHSLSPSITISERNILSLEEKFQGGTGINLTPPPDTIISQHQLQLIKNGVIEIASKFKLENYARIDIFFNVITNEIILIEINTLPALTQSTVIFHQALAESDKIYPLEFLEKIISKKLIS